MGKEAVTVCHWHGDVAEVTLHLDAQFLQTRGALRLDIPRADIAKIAVVEDGLCLTIKGAQMTLEFGAAEAGRWQKALLKKPPTLAEKLGVSADAPAFVWGALDDDTLAKALSGLTVTDVAEAAILVAILMEEADLSLVSDFALAHPAKHIWMVHRKGKQAHVGDTMIRTHMRALGFIDSKTSAVSDALTTTRYRLRAQ